jgi:dTDP-4-dehydrorhamnose 3,5-epimerase
MRFRRLTIDGCFLIEPVRLSDERGFFARTFCVEELGQQGLMTGISQQSVSFNHKAGTLRGLHWQESPHAETKLVRVTMGRIADLILDLRPSSPTYLKHEFVELSAENRSTVLIPTGCAHGFITLVDQCELFYQMDTPYHASSQRGVRYNDPSFGIEWPRSIEVISDRDRSYPDFVA